MGRRVQTFDGAMILCVVKVRLNRDFFARRVSGVAATTTAIEVVEAGSPGLGIVVCSGKTANGVGNHAVNHRLIVTSIGPPRTCAVPGYSRRVVRPSDSAGNDAAGNSYWGRRTEQERPQAAGSRNRQGKLSARHFHFDLLLYAKSFRFGGSFCLKAAPLHRQHGVLVGVVGDLELPRKLYLTTQVDG